MIFSMYLLNNYLFIQKRAPTSRLKGWRSMIFFGKWNHSNNSQ